MINANKRTVLRGRETWIGELVQCVCRHGLGRHWSSGCEGDFRGPCRCRLTRESVLQLAISLEREESR